MIENLYGTFTFGLLLTSISIVVFLLIFKFILWPILKIILTPIIGGWLKIYELYKSINILGILLIFQIILGIFTVIYGAQIYIASMHQISSIFLVSFCVYFFYLNTNTN